MRKSSHPNMKNPKPEIYLTPFKEKKKTGKKKKKENP